VVGKEVRRMNTVQEIMIYLIHYKNFCKCHNIPPPATTNKGKKKELEREKGDITL
jgi:hypothetical protein